MALGRRVTERHPELLVVFPQWTVSLGACLLSEVGPMRRRRNSSSALVS